LDLARRAYEVFESSEDMEKRELLKFLLQNSKMKGKKRVPTLQMPFNAIRVANKTQTGLHLIENVRTYYQQL